tara:strand:+ start:32 stop:427 length:396 start_codon:yes stop_codon:yes gene_type:complete
MNQVLIGILLVLGIFSYYLYSENITLKANNLALEGAIETQKEAMEVMKGDFELQSTQLNELSLKSQAAQRELNRYSQFISEYKLTAKILENPTEMERKINNGTKHIFEDIEKLSGTVDDLDSGLQLQPSGH